MPPSSSPARAHPAPSASRSRLQTWRRASCVTTTRLGPTMPGSTAAATPAWRSRTRAGTSRTTTIPTTTRSCLGRVPPSTNRWSRVWSCSITSSSRSSSVRPGSWTRCSAWSSRRARRISSRWVSRRRCPTERRTTAVAPSAWTRTTGTVCPSAPRPRAAPTCRPSSPTGSALSSTSAAPTTWRILLARPRSAPRTWPSLRSWTGQLTSWSSTSPSDSTCACTPATSLVARTTP
mmetsp:Transcript_89362/g.277979  ORF Transcript_89362/g.277979 Transcript_89362/m.277979 type:complete len:234 (+) Transcript_89362:1036-1737(+)